MPDQICTLLEWDSNFFGLRIARLNRSRLDELALEQAMRWCRDQRINCLYFLADSADPGSLRLAEREHFLQADVRLTLERSLNNSVHHDPEEFVRPARVEDLPALEAIAARSHRDSRFYSDLNFDRAKCDLLYETWIRNSFHGFAEAMLVIESRGHPAGYVTCHLREKGSQIGLIGVAESEQGQGLATKLIQGFLAWSRRNDAERVTVMTQGRNIAAQRLYQRCGFLTHSFQFWYHRWYSAAR